LFNLGDKFDRFDESLSKLLKNIQKDYNAMKGKSIERIEDNKQKSTTMKDYVMQFEWNQNKYANNKKIDVILDKNGKVVSGILKSFLGNELPGLVKLQANSCLVSCFASRTEIKMSGKASYNRKEINQK